MFILPFVTDQASRQLQALGFQWDAILCDKQDISAITVLIDGQNHSGLNAPAARNIFPCSFALDRDDAALPHRFDLASHIKSVLAGRGPGRVGERSEERRVGKECVGTWSSRWSP